jgi:type I restriction enzyme R subunit
MTSPPILEDDYSEDTLVEQPAIALFKAMGWQTANLYHETFGSPGTLGRDTDQEVVLTSRLLPALQRLNPDLPPEALTAAIEELTRDRSIMSPIKANQEIYKLLKEGVKAKFQAEDGSEAEETVKIIDWINPSNNNFFLASQFWVSGEMYRRRCDLVGFVNGIPLVFIELKASHKAIKSAYDNNLRDYRNSIPQLFWYNAFIILSNGSKSYAGSSTAAWEHFSEWKKINDEGEEGVVSLETMIRGTCDPRRILDIAENFTVFEEAQGGLIKKISKNHQYLGVNKAIDAVRNLGTNKGRLGVFWHTQGSGKSISMIFFAQKILRTIPGNWTFVIVTDRDELDDQIHKSFAACGAVTEKKARANSGEDLKRLLTEDHRYVFTLIQKFHTEKGKKYPKLSDRSDIIVITDEAHRSQYETFALNMRTALPNAAFIGFTGTPLMAGEEKTKEVFGDYVSIYNFKQSIDDGATLPLFYENRIPELQLTNENLNEDMEELLEEAELTEEQQQKLEREFAREYHLITREDRLETIAQDIVTHFMGRGNRGKAMVVCIDKATAVQMFDKVQKYWKKHLDSLCGRIPSTTGEEYQKLKEDIEFMNATDMAVVVSQAQNEIEDMKTKGLDIAPHRKRMVKEDLDTKFKDPDDPFRIVFVCAMWMTGFDVPSCSTIYLDKPMRNHTLMQTIARANRVFRDKVNGLIVDYVGVFRSLQKALAIYAPPTRGGETPIKDKSELVEYLKKAIAEATSFCTDHGVNAAEIQGATGLQKVKLLDDAVDSIIVNDDSKRRYLLLAGNVVRLYRAILPDPSANEFVGICVLWAVIAEKIRSLAPPADISEVMGQVEKLLDDSIATEGYQIPAVSEQPAHLVDLSKIDFKKLQAQFAKAHKRIEIEKLRTQISRKLSLMFRYNRSRVDYLEKFQKMIEEYNAGSMNLEEFFAQLLAFAQSLNEEEKRGISENLTEEELALFDLLTKPEPKLKKSEEVQVKKVARDLLETLKREKLVLDWRKRQQTRQAVRVCIEEILDQLPPLYSPELYQTKCELTYQHVYDSYLGEGRSIYAQVV